MTRFSRDLTAEADPWTLTLRSLWHRRCQLLQIVFPDPSLPGTVKSMGHDKGIFSLVWSSSLCNVLFAVMHCFMGIGGETLTRSYHIRSFQQRGCIGDQAQSSEFNSTLGGKEMSSTLFGIIGKPEVNSYALGKENPVTGVFIRQEKESLRFRGWRQAKG